MKIKVFICCVCFFTVSSVFAQNWFVGGSATLDFSVDETTAPDGSVYPTENKRIDIYPTVGYGIDRLDFGVYPMLQFRQSEYNNGSGYSQNSEAFGIGSGLFLRYNFVSIGNFSIRGMLSLDYLYSSSETSISSPLYTSTSEEKSHEISINLKPVFEYRVAAHFSVYSNLGIGGIGGSYKYYSRSANSTGPTGTQDTNGSSFSFNIPSVFNIKITEFSLGFYVHF